MSKKNKKNKNKFKDKAIPRSNTEVKPPRGITEDAFQNVLAKLGVGMPNIMEGVEYPNTRLTKNFQLMNSLYRSHWLIRRIIDVIPQDMCKNWIQVSSQITPEHVDQLNRATRRIQLKAKILEGLRWGRLYGGAVGVFMIEGQDDMLDQPLDLDTVMPGSFKGLMILDRWSGVYPNLQLVKDISDPEFGLPESYQITTGDGNQTTVHHSRLIRFTGRDLPFWEKQAETYWGASEIEHVFDELKKRDNTSWNIAYLVFLANLRVMKMADLGQLLSTGNEQAQKRVYNTLQAQNMLMSNMGIYVMDKEDEFDTKQYTFSGLAEIYEMFMYDISGAAEIPVTKLFGRSPAGMNSTGESDMQNYYDMISDRQESVLRPILDKVMPVFLMSEFGAIPDDFDYRFNPVNKLTEQEKAELSDKATNAIMAVYNAGIISHKIALKELKHMEDITGMWSNITDEDIDMADNSMGMGGELPGVENNIENPEEGNDIDEEPELETNEQNREPI